MRRENKEGWKKNETNKNLRHTSKKKWKTNQPIRVEHQEMKKRNNSGGESMSSVMELWMDVCVCVLDE